MCSSLCSWFAVHCTSMNNTNTLISGDNKGYASYLMEMDMNNGALPGQVRACILTICKLTYIVYGPMYVHLKFECVLLNCTVALI